MSRNILKDWAGRFRSEAPGVSAKTEWADQLTRSRHAGPRMSVQTALDPATHGTGTLAVHAGSYNDPVTGAVGTPVFNATTFLFQKESYDAFDQGMIRDYPIYTRYGNPTQWAVQDKIAALEHAESAIVFSSGMAAISTTLLALTTRGGHIVTARDLYGGSFNLLRDDMHQFGREVSFVDPTDAGAIEAAIRDNTQLLFFETLTNPLLKCAPVSRLGELARERDLFLALDNTFLTPVCMTPMDLGAHVVLHSGTKYLNGHSDLVAGSAAGSRKYLDMIWNQMLKLGGSLNPQDCAVLERGLKTLDLRMRAHVANAREIAHHLADHPGVGRVYHPDLPDYPYDWAAGLLPRGAGGMVSFEVRGGDEAGLKLMSELKIIKAATSLGGVESLISMPFNTSHSSMVERQRREVGINPGLVRLSVGVEDVGDLRKDLSAALAAATGEKA